MEYYTAVKTNSPNAAYDHVVMSGNELLRTSEPGIEANATFIELKTRRKLNSKQEENKYRRRQRLPVEQRQSDGVAGHVGGHLCWSWYFLKSSEGIRGARLTILLSNSGRCRTRTWYLRARCQASHTLHGHALCAPSPDTQ